MFTLESSAFSNNAPIPPKFSREGGDTSPPLRWSGAPDHTKAFALICEDPDAPALVPWTHWVLGNLPGDCNGLEEGATGGAVEGANDFGEPGYGGPIPPEGSGPHHYHFKLHALDAPVDFQPGGTKDALNKAMDSHIIETAELVGIYER